MSAEDSKMAIPVNDFLDTPKNIYSSDPSKRSTFKGMSVFYSIRDNSSVYGSKRSVLQQNRFDQCLNMVDTIQTEKLRKKELKLLNILTELCKNFLEVKELTSKHIRDANKKLRHIDRLNKQLCNIHRMLINEIVGIIEKVKNVFTIIKKHKEDAKKESDVARNYFSQAREAKNPAHSVIIEKGKKYHRDKGVEKLMKKYSRCLNEAKKAFKIITKKFPQHHRDYNKLLFENLSNKKTLKVTDEDLAFHVSNLLQTSLKHSKTYQDCQTKAKNHPNPVKPHNFHLHHPTYNDILQTGISLQPISSHSDSNTDPSPKKKNSLSNSSSNISIKTDSSEMSSSSSKDVLYFSCEDSLQHQKKQKKAFNKSTNKDRLDCMQAYKFITLISRGAYGVVWLVQRKSTGDHYAMKLSDYANTLEKNQDEVLIKEAKILEKIRGEWIVKAVASFTYRMYLCSVMEYMPGGDLLSAIERESYFDEVDAKFYIAQIVLAVEC